MSEVKINGVTLELDMLDADVVEKFEKRCKKIVADINEPEQYKDLSNADQMRLQCRLVEEFFDDIFGKGTAVQIFDKPNHLGEHLEAFGQAMELTKQGGNDVHAIVDKYSPDRVAQNREQRRAAQHGKGKRRYR